MFKFKCLSGLNKFMWQIPNNDESWYSWYLIYTLGREGRRQIKVLRYLNWTEQISEVREEFGYKDTFKKRVVFGLFQVFQSIIMPIEMLSNVNL